jgi:hypothetical protein
MRSRTRSDVNANAPLNATFGAPVRSLERADEADCAAPRASAPDPEVDGLGRALIDCGCGFACGCISEGAACGFGGVMA